MDRMVLEEDSFPQVSFNRPYIEPEHSANVTSVVGGQALLNCRVYNLGNKTVRV